VKETILMLSTHLSFTIKRRAKFKTRLPARKTITKYNKNNKYNKIQYNKKYRNKIVGCTNYKNTAIQNTTKQHLLSKSIDI